MWILINSEAGNDTLLSLAHCHAITRNGRYLRITLGDVNWGMSTIVHESETAAKKALLGILDGLKENLAVIVTGGVLDTSSL